jgi:hypothetical protein
MPFIINEFRMKKIILALLLILLLTGCGSATPAPVVVPFGSEFTLAPNQIATVLATWFIRLDS